jgi:hypothetical protein
VRRSEEEALFPLLLRHVQSQPVPLREVRVQHIQLEGFARKLFIAVAAGNVERETSEVVEVGDGRWEVRASGPPAPDMTRDLIGEVRLQQLG